MRKRLSASILIVCALYVTSCSRQALRPLDVAKEIFKPEVSPDFVIRHSTGDYSGRPDGSDIPATTKMSFTVIQERNDKAVIAMNTTDSSGRSQDQYLFFTKENALWKMFAIAKPTLARMHEWRKEEMEALSPSQLDSLLIANQQLENPPYKTREEFYFILNSLRLKLMPDDSLMAHFQRHRPVFEQLLFEVKTKPAADETETFTLVNTRTTQYSPLLVSNVTTGGFLPAECIDFHILNDQVGYLYTPDKKYLPELYPDKVMVLRALGGGWYLYKVAIYL